jgi:hypothetical protein
MTVMAWLASPRSTEGAAFACALGLWLAAACGHDELLSGDDLAPSHAGGAPQGSGGAAGSPVADASTDGQDAALHGNGGSSGAADAASGGAAGAAGQLADAGDAASIAPDFALEDVNPASSLYQTTVSPRDFLGKVSAWYFGHST